MSEQYSPIERFNKTRLSYLAMVFGLLLSQKDYTVHASDPKTSSSPGITWVPDTSVDIKPETAYSIPHLSDRRMVTVPREGYNNKIESRLSPEIEHEFLNIIDKALDKHQEGVEASDGYDELRNYMLRKFKTEDAFEKATGYSFDVVARIYLEKYYVPFTIPSESMLPIMYNEYKDLLDPIFQIPQIIYITDSEQLAPGVASAEIRITGNSANDGNYVIKLTLERGSTVAEKTAVDTLEQDSVEIPSNKKQVKIYTGFSGLEQIQTDFLEGGQKFASALFKTISDEYHKRLSDELWKYLWAKRTETLRKDFEHYRLPDQVREYIESLVKDKEAGTFSGDGYDELKRCLLNYYHLEDSMSDKIRYQFAQKTRGFDCNMLTRYLLNTYAPVFYEKPLKIE